MKLRTLWCVLLVSALGINALPARAQDRTYESMTVSTTAVGFAAGTLNAGFGDMTSCTAQVEDAAIRYTVSGTTPTATVGVPIASGVYLTITGEENLLRFRAIRSGGSDASMQWECTRQQNNEVGITGAATSGAGGTNTEYTEGATDTTITGIAALAENGDTLSTIRVDASGLLQVDIADDSFGVGGGTQYTDDTNVHATGTSVGTPMAAVATPTDGSVDANDFGVPAMSTDRRLLIDADITAQSTGDLTIADGGNDISIDDGGNMISVDWAGTSPPVGAGVEATALRVTVATDSTGVVSVDDNGGDLSIDDGGNDISVDWSGTAPPIGAGTEAAALRVTVATDSTGVVSVDDNGGDLSVDNGGTFVVQEDGAALTALQVIDNPVFADDAAFTLASSSVSVGGAIRDDSLSTLTAVEGDAVPFRVSSTGALHVTGSAGVTEFNVDDAAGATDAGNLALVVRDDSLTTLTPADGDYTQLRVNSTGALHVTGGGGGTEYVTNVAAPADPTGTTITSERDDALSSLTEIEGDWTNSRANANGALWVAIDNSETITLDANSGVDIGDVDVTSLNDGGNVISVDWNGTAPPVGAGVEATALRVTLATDSTGLVSVDDNGGDLSIDDGGNSITTDDASIATEGSALGSGVLIQGDDGTDRTNVLVDTSGHLQVDVLSGGLAGTEYTEDAAAAGDPDGGVVILVRDDTLTGQTTADGDNIAQRGTDYGAAYVTIANSDGSVPDLATDQTEDAAEAGGETGPLVLTVRRDTAATSAGADADFATLNTDASGRLWTHDDVLDATVSGSEQQVDVVAALPAGTNNIGDVDVLSIAAGDNNIGNVDIVTFPDNEPVNVALMNGTAVTMGNGASGAGVQRVTIASDSTGVLSVDDNGGSLTVDATNLDVQIGGSDTVTVDLAANNDVTIDGSTVVKAEDDASANFDTGVVLLARRTATPADTSGADLDYEALQMDNGRLWTSTLLGSNSGVDIGDVDVLSIAAGDNNIGNVDIVTFPDNEPVDVALMNGVAVSMGNGASGAGVQRVTIASDTTGVLSVDDNGSTLSIDGQNGVAPIFCNSAAFLDMTTATTTQIVALSGSTDIYVCSYAFHVGGASDVKLVSGTGTNCATGQADITQNYDFAAADAGINRGGGGIVAQTDAGGDAICVTSSQAVDVSVSLAYAQF